LRLVSFNTFPVVTTQTVPFFFHICDDLPLLEI